MIGIISVAIAYVLGSIPFAFIFAHLIRGTDIRRVGTGNAGAMNTIREVGLLPGIAVLLLDIAKGSLAVLITQWLGAPLLFVFLAGFAAVAGHNWTPFLKFNGGRGIATTLGVILAITPLEFGISFVVILTIFLFTRSSGLAVGIGLALLPLVMWVFGRELSLILYSLALSIFLVSRNILTFSRDLAKSGSLGKLMFQKHPPLWPRKKG
ncbi:glycerol-3-phosphate acyltransferase [Chloroflexota bacterium]